MSKHSKTYWFEIRSCLSKVKHTTLKEALDILLKQQSKGLTVDNIYKCVFCNQYHIGHYKNRYKIYNMVSKILHKE